MEGLGGTQHLALLASKDEENDANHNGPDASPDRDVDRLLLLDRQLNWSELDLMSFLGETEAAVQQPEDTGCDQDDYNVPRKLDK